MPAGRRYPACPPPCLCAVWIDDLGLLQNCAYVGLLGSEQTLVSNVRVQLECMKRLGGCLCDKQLGSNAVCGLPLCASLPPLPPSWTPLNSCTPACTLGTAADTADTHTPPLPGRHVTHPSQAKAHSRTRNTLTSPSQWTLTQRPPTRMSCSASRCRCLLSMRAVRAALVRPLFACVPCCPSPTHSSVCSCAP